MKLTNEVRDRIVRSVLADVPTVDYAGQMQTRVTDICIAALPEPVRRVWDDPAIRWFIVSGSIYLDCMILSMPGWKDRDDPVYTIVREDSELSSLHKFYDDQRSVQGTLCHKLKLATQMCSTEKQFRDKYPELAKYLPQAVYVENLPTTSDLVDSLRVAGVQLETVAA